MNLQVDPLKAFVFPWKAQQTFLKELLLCTGNYMQVSVQTGEPREYCLKTQRRNLLNAWRIYSMPSTATGPCTAVTTLLLRAHLFSPGFWRPACVSSLPISAGEVDKKTGTRACRFKKKKKKNSVKLEKLESYSNVTCIVLMNDANHSTRSQLHMLHSAATLKLLKIT